MLLLDELRQAQKSLHRASAAELCGRAADEIERLRGQLQAILDHTDGNGMGQWKCAKVARKALSHDASYQAK